MRIAILNNFAHVTGGADRHCFDLAHILRASGHDVRFLSTAAPDNIESIGAFVPLRVKNATRDTLPPWTRAAVALRAVWNRETEGAMKQLLREFQPDVVHCHKIYPHLSVAPIQVARRARVPIVQTLHDYEFVSASAVDITGSRTDRNETRAEYRALNTVLFQLKRQYHVPAVGTWVAVSRAVAATYAAHGIQAVSLPNFTRPTHEAVPGFSERAGICFAGQLTRVKGIHDVIELARAMPDIPVRIAGRGPLVTEVQAAATQLPNLEYVGMLPAGELHRHLRESRLCVMPSRWEEPGPLACLEAMTAGTPIVAYAVGGLAEYVEDARSGVVVSPETSALVEACRETVANRPAWEDMSRNAATAVQTTHSAERYLESILDVYTQAVGSR